MHNPSSPKHLMKQNVDVQRLGRTEAGGAGGVDDDSLFYRHRSASFKIRAAYTVYQTTVFTLTRG